MPRVTAAYCIVWYCMVLYCIVCIYDIIYNALMRNGEAATTVFGKGSSAQRTVLVVLL
jgi:hypothetical protein